MDLKIFTSGLKTDIIFSLNFQKSAMLDRVMKSTMKKDKG